MGLQKVLVVDDDSEILELVTAVLSPTRYEVITATSGEQALQLVQSEEPDIMLLDIVMVPLTGFDVLDRLRKFSKLPVVVFSAQSRITDQALALGANGFVPKPFKPGELERKIEDALAIREV